MHLSYYKMRQNKKCHKKYQTKEYIIILTQLKKLSTKLTLLTIFKPHNRNSIKHTYKVCINCGKNVSTVKSTKTNTPNDYISSAQ